MITMLSPWADVVIGLGLAFLLIAAAELLARVVETQGRGGPVERETRAKIRALEKQLRDAQTETRERITQRIAALRADHEVRATKLKQPWTLTKKALAA